MKINGKQIASYKSKTDFYNQTKLGTHEHKDKTAHNTNKTKNMYSITKEHNIIIYLLLKSNRLQSSVVSQLKDIVLDNYYSEQDRILLNNLRGAHYTMLLDEYPLLVKEQNEFIPVKPNGKYHPVKGVNTFQIYTAPKPTGIITYIDYPSKLY